MNYPGYDTSFYELLARERLRHAQDLERRANLCGQLVPRTPLTQRVKRLIQRSA